jgi:hypothetical protein
MISYILNSTGVSIVCLKTLKSLSVSSSHLCYEDILEELKKGVSADFETLSELSSIKNRIEGATFGNVVVTADAVYYKNKNVGNHLTRRILTMLKEGYDITPWALFMDNLMKNPSKTAQDELYLFLESGSLPITPDGHFLAFKNVNADLTSIHDGKTQHVIGQMLSMPREDVNPNRDETCSYGLHFASQGYLPSYNSVEGCKTLILKVNPADVVAIPSDYKNQKGRAFQYLPIGIVSEDSVNDPIYQKPVVGKVGTVYVDNFEPSEVPTKLASVKTFLRGLKPKQFLKEVKAAGGVRPWARENDVARSTAQDWFKKVSNNG